MKLVKKIFYIILLITIETYAQETIVNINEQQTTDSYTEEIFYFKDVNNVLDKFVGNWVFVNGIHELNITITKHYHELIGVPDFININDYEDCIHLKYIYKLNGVEKYNISGGIGGSNVINNNKISLIYYEPSLISCNRAKKANLSLEFINDLPSNKLIWTRKDQVAGGILQCENGTYYDTTDFLIPENLVLIKQ